MNLSALTWIPRSLIYLLFIFLISSCSVHKKRHPVLQGGRHTGSSQNTPSNKAGHSSSSQASSGAKRNSSSQQYIDQYKAVAIAEMNKYGIPASIKLAQALLESGNGNSYLAREANNHFGIKCAGGWTGKTVTRPDDAINDCFRVYNNPEQSFRDHSEFLLRKRYEGLFKLNKNDYKGWARGLKSAGYATNPRYAELVIDLIERYELYQYDRAESYVEKEKREVVVKQEIIHNTLEEPVRAELLKSPVAMRIHEVKPKETLYGISRQYNVTIEQIKQYNGLIDDNLSIGQMLVISK